MSYANCPYCKEEVEINHDDGYGYDENEIHTQECSKCGKTFAYTTMISIDHDTKQAPCQNGDEHDLHPIEGCREEFFKGRSRCSWCGEEVVDSEVNGAAIKRYSKTLLDKEE